MTRPARNGTAMDRLVYDARAWLPSGDPEAQRRILGLLIQAAETGADPIAVLRDGLRRWFGTGAAAMLPGCPSPIPVLERETMPLEPLIAARRPTLWPRRPKRLPDELFSGWLWRCATASHVSPALLAVDALGSSHDDIDRDVAPEIVRRLACFTGQTIEHLAAGTLPVIPWAPQDTIGGMIEDLLLADDRLLLTLRAKADHRRDRPILAYCPSCLANDTTPYFRRRWRFAPFVVCLAHRAMLRDCCWKCRSRIDVLAPGRPGGQPGCGTCGALLRDAPATPRSVAARVAPRQRNLNAMLSYLVTYLPARERNFHLDYLTRQFRPSRLHGRARVMATLLPATAHIWFGAPIDSRHDTPLRMLAGGVTNWRRDPGRAGTRGITRRHSGC
jgi:TniQ